MNKQTSLIIVVIVFIIGLGSIILATGSFWSEKNSGMDPMSVKEDMSPKTETNLSPSIETEAEEFSASLDESMDAEIQALEDEISALEDIDADIDDIDSAL